MPRLNLDVDEGTILKAYSIGSLNPRKWEVVNHDFEPDVPSSLLSPTSLADRESDALGLGTGRNVRDLDMETKAAVLLTSKQFDPSTYLSTVHPNATHHDLARGVSYLHSAIESRSEALRILVEDNFDRFVAVKACTDALYEGMKEGVLDPQAECGSRPLRDHLKASAQKANQIYIPVLESAEKANKLRTTLGVFSRSRFFFNLPAFIIESVEAGRYEIALRDYKKGKFLLENRPSQLLPIGPSASTTSNSNTKDDPSSTSSVTVNGSSTGLKGLQQQQKRILDKVWLSVEKAMGEMRKALVAQLKDGTKSVEEYERALDMLLELKSHEDPLWIYFDSQHTQIMERINRAYLVAVKQIDEANLEHGSQRASPESLEPTLADELRIALGAVETKQPEAIWAKSSGEPVWKAILDGVKSITDVLSSSFPTFWKMATNFMDGKFKVANTTVNSRRSPTQCKTMALDITKLYISVLSELFVLSDMAASTSSAAATAQKEPTKVPILPKTGHSLCTAFYLHKILGEVQECVVEMMVLEVSGDVNGCLKELMECVKWRFEEIVVTAWLRDARFFHRLETWIISPQNPSHTNYLTQFEHFQRQLCISAYKIATGTDFRGPNPSSSSSTSTRPTRRLVIPQAFTQRITKAFLDALYGFLDGMVFLATENTEEGKVSRALVKQKEVLEKILGPRLMHVYEGRHNLLDLADQTVRLLLVICNLNALADVFIPSILSQFEGAFNVSLTEDRATLTAVVSELDRTLFESYLQPKLDYITARLRDAILGGDIDWYREPPPTAVRPYVYDVLNFLVDTHSEIYGIAETLLERGLTTLVDGLVAEATASFKQVRRMGTGGLLLAVLELKLIHKSLGFYVKPETSGALTKLYNKQIPKAYIPPSRGLGVQDYLDEVDQLLLQTRRACAIQFLCFKQAKNSKASSGTANTPSTAKPRDNHVPSSATSISSPSTTPRAATAAILSNERGGLSVKTTGLSNGAEPHSSSLSSSVNRRRNGSFGQPPSEGGDYGPYSAGGASLSSSIGGGGSGSATSTPALPAAVPSYLSGRGRSESVSSSTSRTTNTSGRGLEKKPSGYYI